MHKRARGHDVRALQLPFFYVQKQTEAKQGRKAQLERVMHKRAGGHDVRAL